MRMTAGDHAGAVDIWRQAILLHQELQPPIFDSRRHSLRPTDPTKRWQEYLTAISLKSRH
jgi:hypothetical protein